MNGESAVSKGQNSFNCDLKVGEPFKVSLALINNSGLVMPPSFLVPGSIPVLRGAQENCQRPEREDDCDQLLCCQGS